MVVITGDGPAPPRLVVLGSINQDITVITAHLPDPGQTVMGTALRRTLGGKGANQAVSAAKAGAQVAMIGCVGADAEATMLVAELASHGVDIARVRRVQEPTGTAVITVEASAENTIVVVPGANGALLVLGDDDLDEIAGADLLLLQLELPIAVVLAGAGAAARAGVPVLLNPSPAQTLPPQLLAGLTILVLNEGEAAALGPAALASARHLVTTLGARGATYAGPEESFSVPAPVVAALDTTGAGDAFVGAFAAAWARGDSPLSAVRRGCTAGALAATQPGAGTAAPTSAAIDELAASTYG
jgi:ribokinase